MPVEELFEQLAAIEHERWADWQQWLHDRLERVEGGWFLSSMQRDIWQRQIETPYVELSEAEKDSDREQVRRYWPLIEAYIEE